MNEYEMHAREFLDSCNAKIEIKLVGKEINHQWNDTKPRNKYQFIITTPKGNMMGDFWDSIINTQISSMNYKDYCALEQKQGRKYMMSLQMFKESKKLAKPNAYSILACLEKYDVGTMDDFMHEFGYEINCVQDMANLMTTYNAVVKQYRDLCRIFTPEQMELLREIY